LYDLGKAPAGAVPHVVDELCNACRKWLARSVCRTKAILKIDPGEPPFIDGNLCYGCLACVPVCPQGAIVLDKPRPRSDEGVQPDASA
jgi:MinD superfamily P-loop ATPase